jgi:NAD kinase
MYERVVILTRLSEKVALERRYGTAQQAAFMMARSKKGTSDFSRATSADVAQTRAQSLVRQGLPREIQVVEIDRTLVAQFVFDPGDLVVALGQDGLVANVGKYLQGQPLAGVNPDPSTIDGALLPFTVESFLAALPDILRGKRAVRSVVLAEAVSDDGQILRGFNEIFVGAPSHQSARYRLSFEDASELQSSSGLIAATGSGSTGWFKSIAGEGGVFDPGEESLRFRVREAWPGRGFSASLVSGNPTRDRPLVVESHMPSGVVFADGIEDDAIAFDAGVSIRIAPSERRVSLLI